MIRKKILNLIIVLLISVSSLFLAACGPKTNPGGGNNNGGNNGGGNNGGEIEVPEIPETPGNDKTVDEMFSKFKIITKDNSVKVIDPTNEGALTNFNELLERQIDVLANDILYRLVAVYGAGANTTNNISGNEKAYLINNNITLSPYSYNSLNAYISNYNLIKPSSEIYLGIPVYKYDDGTEITTSNMKINHASSYARELYTGNWTNYSDHLLTLHFKNTNAINGGYYWDEVAGFNTVFNNNLNWNWDYENLNINEDTSTAEVHSEYKSEYLEVFKTEIANILAGTNNLEFEQAVNEIEYLGFKKADREKISQFVMDSIIGESQVKLDNYIFDNILNKLTDYNVSNINDDKEELETASENADFDEFNLVFNHEEEETYWLKKHMWHYFKAYNILVPEMLDRAFSNSFGGLEIDRVKYIPGSEPKLPILVDGVVQKYDLDEYESFETIEDVNYISLYPKMTRSSQFDIKVEENAEDVKMTDEFFNIKSLILQPKTDVSLLELWMAISTETNIRVKFQVKVKYVANGAIYLNDYVKSTANDGSTVFDITGMYDTDPSLAGDGVPWYFDLNISDHITKNSAGHYVALDGTTTSPNYPVMNVYNGKDLSVNDYDLWNNNPFKLSGYESGDNYVELSFNILEAWELDGSTSTEYYGDVLFSIGFSDPWF